MALVKDPVARARKVTTKQQAARLHLELESELALNDALPEGWEQKADEALRILEAKFGGAEELRDADAVGEWSPSMSKRAQSKLGDDPSRPAAKAPAPEQRRQARERVRRGAAASSSRRTGRRRGGGGRLPRAVGKTGVPAAAQGAGDLALELLGVMIGLSLVYLLLANPRGPRAVSQIFGAVSGFVHALIGPGDPLAPKPLANVPVETTGPVTVIPYKPTPPASQRHPIGATP